MKYIIVTIRDEATEAYMRPFIAQTENQAIRMFEDETLRPESIIGEHPEHYILFNIGTFNDSTGHIESREPKALRRAHEIQQKEETQPELQLKTVS